MTTSALPAELRGRHSRPVANNGTTEPSPWLVMLTIQFDSPESVQAFLGSSVSSDQDLTAYSFNLEITKENNRILIDNGFYDAVTTNTPINIIASDFIYMDGNFFYIASISYNGTEYLSFDVGFENIKKMIHENASLL